ncbi:MAG: RsmE family RNA methyltransferase [Actinomycetota bacterium]
MTSARFFLSSVNDDVLEIRGGDAVHAVRVLRISPGETITISDGAGAVATARVIAAGTALRAQVLDRAAVPQPRPRITVYQALTKQGRLDDVVNVLTQIGVDAIVPVRAQRSVPRWDERKAAAQTQRLRSIAREAAMQSRRAWLPRIGEVAGVDAIPGGAIVLHEEATARLRDLLPAQAPEELALAAGPEGGFDPDEIAALEGRGCDVATLGPLVLRTELAATAGVIAVRTLYGLLA